MDAEINLPVVAALIDDRSAQLHFIAADDHLHVQLDIGICFAARRGLRVQPAEALKE